MTWPRICPVLILMITAPRFLLAEANKSTSSPEDEPRIAALTVTPAGEPDPALKYLLLPPPSGQTPGNAEARLYMAAHLAQSAGQADDDLDDRLYDWLDLPVNELPSDDVNKLLTRYKDAIHYATLGARQEWCEWDFPIRTEGFNVLLPSLAQYRTLGRLLAFQARIAIAEGRFDDAIERLQTGYALARHVGNGATIINNLVGIAIGALMSRQVEFWIDTPDSPNLYWALTNLPDPLVDSQRAIYVERDWLYLAYPVLNQLKTTTLTEQQCQELRDEFFEMQAFSNGQDPKQPSWQDRLGLATATAAVYPQAKEYLMSLGRTPEEIQAMPAQQVAMIYSLDRFNHWRDEIFKLLSLPYWQGHDRLEEVDRAFERIRNNPGEGWPFSLVLPSLHRYQIMRTRDSRDFAALRCVEALRLYASNNDGRLPENLEQITLVPIPINPVTGKQFGYHIEGQTAILDAAVIEGMRARDATRYEINIAR